MNVHVTCLISASHVTPVSFNPQEGQNVCWMNQTTCMWLMPFKSSFLFFTSPHGPFEFERWWKWVFFAFYITCMNFMGISWMRPFFCGPELWGGERETKLKKTKTKKHFGVSVPKRPFSFSGSWYSENILWHIVGRIFLHRRNSR